MVSEWDLICADAWMLHLGNMGFFVGWIAGSLIFGWLAEEFGERMCSPVCHQCLTPQPSLHPCSP